MLPNPGEQGLHPVGRVGPDLRQPGHRLADPLEDLNSPVPIGRSGGQDRQTPDQAQGIDQHVSLAARHLLAPVIALGATGLRRLDRLAVDDGGTRRRLSGGDGTDPGPEGVVDQFPHPGVPPGVEVVGDGLPGREIVGQHPPRAAAPGQVEGGVDDLPQGVLAGASPLAGRPGEQVFDVVPLQVRQVAGVTLSVVHLLRLERTRNQQKAISRRPVTLQSLSIPALFPVGCWVCWVVG
jgi:hypothetical protein